MIISTSNYDMGIMGIGLSTWRSNIVGTSKHGTSCYTSDLIEPKEQFDFNVFVISIALESVELVVY